MTTNYTKIDKASGTSYIPISSGNVMYDDVTTTYDSSTVNYDGLFNQTPYVNISKPSLTKNVVTTLDFYSESNKDNQDSLSSSALNFTDVGQAFNSPVDAILTSCQFYLSRGNSSSLPTGNAVAKLWSMTGVMGTNALPTGSAIATSDNFDVSTLNASSGIFTLIPITFSGANQYAIQGGTTYGIAIEYAGGDISNSLKIGFDNSSATHQGNKFHSSNNGSTWTLNSLTQDVCFYVIGLTAINSYAKINKAT